MSSTVPNYSPPLDPVWVAGVEQPLTPRHRRTKLRLAIVCVLAGVGISLWRLKETGGAKAASVMAATPQAVLTRTAAARTGNMMHSLDALGTVTPLSTVNVYSQVSGQVMAVHYREGQMVHTGDALLDIDGRSYSAQLEQAQGTLDRDRGYLRQAEIDLARYREAYAEHAVAKQILDDQEQTLTQFSGAVRNDEGQVAYAQVQLSYCHVVAPTSGRIGLRLVDAGNTVFAGGSAPLLTITSMAPMTVVFNVPEDGLAEVRQQMGRSASLQVLALDRDGRERLASGQLASLDNQIDAATGTLRLRAQFANENAILYPNQFVTARLQLRELKAITIVPTLAVQHNGTQAFVYTARGGIAAVQTVKVLESNDQETGVDGLRPGTSVALTSFDRLKEGARIQVQNESQDGGSH